MDSKGTTAPVKWFEFHVPSRVNPLAVVTSLNSGSINTFSLFITCSNVRVTANIGEAVLANVAMLNNAASLLFFIILGLIFSSLY